MVDATAEPAYHFRKFEYPERRIEVVESASVAESTERLDSDWSPEPRFSEPIFRVGDIVVGGARMKVVGYAPSVSVTHHRLSARAKYLALLGAFVGVSGAALAAIFDGPGLHGIAAFGFGLLFLAGIIQRRHGSPAGR